MIYEYYCPHCDAQLEIEHSVKDKPKTHCPRCSQYGVIRQISKTTFVLKGGCWSHDNYGAAKKDVASDD